MIFVPESFLFSFIAKVYCRVLFEENVSEPSSFRRKVFCWSVTKVTITSRNFVESMLGSLLYIIRAFHSSPLFLISYSACGLLYFPFRIPSAWAWIEFLGRTTIEWFPFHIGMNV